jgi:hypothetical protein
MRSSRYRNVVLSGLVSLLLIVTLWSNGFARGGYRSEQPGDSQSTPLIDSNLLYLPFIQAFYPVISLSAGVETFALKSKVYLDKIDNLNVSWVRSTLFDWNLIEPIRTNPPTYNWDKVNAVGLELATQRGFNIIAIIKNTPLWAQKYPGIYCGAIHPDYLDAFVQFIQAIVTRYSVPPYNVKYWEIGNEPDVGPAWVPPTSIFGCWGEENDPYYGGGYYAEMLKKVYPAIKAIDPQAKVLNGGLLMYCDPTHPPPTNNCLATKFFEGILRNQGGQYFDIVSFHGYPYYSYGQIVDESHPRWSFRGGFVLGKANYLREVMASYNVNKPLFLTEVSLTCPNNSTGCQPPSADFYEAQADYVIWLYVRSFVAGIDKVIWFTIEDPGWGYSGLIDKSGQKPVYNAYQFMNQEIGNAAYSRQVNNYSTLQGYEFTRDGKRIWVLWAPDRVNYLITLPDGVIQVYDKYGVVISPKSGQITVNSPVYVEIKP